MVRETPKRRLFKLLRRAAKSAQPASVTDENALWLSHQRALAVLRDAQESTQRITASVAKQRGSLEASSDRARSVGTRAHDVSTSFARVIDAFERLGLVALNAGLEGARIGEGAGRSLSLVADEVRNLSGRGGEGARELAGLLVEISGELGQMVTHLDQVRESSNETAHEAARASAATAEADRALVEMTEGLKQATDSDAETVMAVAEASEHARALVASLGTLTGRVPRTLLLSALRPMLEPLARLLAEDDAGDATAEEG